MLPFDQVIPKSKIDKDFGETLEAELPGMLNWALEGCLVGQRTGVKQPFRVHKATKGYRSDMDVMSQFMDERIVKQVGKKERGGEVYKVYTAWALEQGERPVSNKVFGLALVERGLEKKRSGNANYYLDIKVLRNDR